MDFDPKEIRSKNYFLIQMTKMMNGPFLLKTFVNFVAPLLKDIFSIIINLSIDKKLSCLYLFKLKISLSF